MNPESNEQNPTQPPQSPPPPPQPPQQPLQPQPTTPTAPTPLTPPSPASPGPVLPGVNHSLPPAAPVQPVGLPPANHDILSHNPPSRKKRLLMVGIPLLVLVLVGIGLVMFYLQSRPGAVWNTGINRTGQALEQVVESATETEKLEAYASSDVDGNFSAEFDGNSIYGDIAANYDKKSSDTNLNVTVKSDGDSDKKLSAQLMTELPDGRPLPDFYLKVNGLETLGLDAFFDASLIQQVNNRWVLISSEYLESLGGVDDQQSGQLTSRQPSAADVAELARAASSVTRDYVLTTDESKAVLINKDFVGKETVDGKQTYHYKVGINVNNAVAYCKALTSAELSTKAFKTISNLSDEAITEQKRDASKYCEEQVRSSWKDNTQLQDIWIDAKYKLIHKIRIHDKDNQNDYVDLGQRYDGGDELTFFANTTMSSSNTKGALTVTLNNKTNVTKLTGTVTGSGGEKYKITVNMTAKPLKSQVKIAPPADAIKIEDLMSQLEAQFMQTPAPSNQDQAELPKLGA